MWPSQGLIFKEALLSFLLHNTPQKNTEQLNIRIKKPEQSIKYTFFLILASFRTEKFTNSEEEM
jgi:hypothetical protein